MNRRLLKSIFLFAIGLGNASAQNSPASITVDSLAVTPADLSATSAAAIERYQRRQAFLDNYFLRVSAATIDTALSFKIYRNSENPFAISRKELSGIGPARDFIGEAIRRRDAGNAPGFNLGSLLSQGLGALVGQSASTKERQRLRIIPSETEIKVLHTLWEQKKATGSAIYANLDSAQITAVDLENVLSGMTERGLLTRQQILPRHEFTIVTPFGAMPIEMSALNRKNREYLYQPTVSSGEMWSFLDASLFNLQSAGDGLLTEHLRRLLRLLATPAQE